MAVDFTSTQLLAAIKRRVTTPTSQRLLTDEDILANATDEMVSSIIPLFVAARDDYFLKYVDYTVTLGTVEYAIPPRAIGNKVKDVQWVDQYGNWTRLPRQNTDDTTISDYGFSFRGNKIRISPDPTQNPSEVLRVYYYARPGELVKPTAAAKISGINTGTNTVTVSTLPATWAAAQVCDFISATPPFDSLAWDMVIQGISGTDIQFTTALPAALSIGDYIAEKYESPIVQLPLEGHQLLVQGTALRILEELGDKENFQVAAAAYERVKEGFNRAVSPRAETSGKVINNRERLVRTRPRFFW